MPLHPARPRVRRLSAAAAVLAAAATLTACGSDDGAEHAKQAPTSHRQLKINAELKSAAKNMATLEETYYVDHLSYTDDGAALAGSGQLRFAKATELAVSVDGAGERYCIRAWSRVGEVDTPEKGFIFSSDGGGLRDPGEVAGWCAETTADDFVEFVGS